MTKKVAVSVVGTFTGIEIVYHDGTKERQVDGKTHRIDGPAVEHVDGTKEWWVRGTRLLILIGGKK